MAVLRRLAACAPMATAISVGGATARVVASGGVAPTAIAAGVTRRWTSSHHSPASGLAGTKVALFDLYGTLVDVHSAVARQRHLVGTEAEAETFSKLWRAKQLEYTWLRSLMGNYANFWVVTGDALDFAMETCGVEDRGGATRAALMDAYLSLEAYLEVAATLAELQAAGITTAIMSNGSRPMIEAAVTSAGLTRLLDSLISVDDAKVYKSHPKAYQLSCDRFGIQPQEAVFLSANPFDIAGASSFGHRVIRVNRVGEPWRERLGFDPAAEVSTLAELPHLLGI